MDVNKNIYNTKESIKGLVDVDKNEIKRYNVKPNDLFFTRTSETSDEIGLTSAYTGELMDCVFSGFILRARPIKKDINSLFFAYYLRSDKSRSNIIKYSSITTRALISGSNLYKMKVRMPKIDEQNKIAGFLSAIDKKIELLEKTHNKFEILNFELINRIMEQHFKIPNQNNIWEKITLKDIGSSYTGLSGKNKDDFNKGNSKFIPYRSIFNDIILDNSKFENVLIHEAENQNLVAKGDIFFTGSSETPEEVGMASVLSEDLENCYLNSFCFGFRLNSFEMYNPLFLVYYFRSLKFKKELFKLAQGSTRFNISKKELLKKEIEVPSKIEQDYYVCIINNMFMKINHINEELSSIKNFKKGLLQKMFV